MEELSLFPSRELIVIPNYVPYFALVAITILLFAFAWRKADRVNLIPFYICISGLIYIFELVVFVLLNSYHYMPDLLSDPFYDSALGAVVSNGFIVPAACVFIAVYNLGFWMILLIAAAFMGIEQLFIHWGIYEHVWWKAIYTGIGQVFLFLLGRLLWRKMNHKHLPFPLRLTILYIINVSLQGSVQFFYIILFHHIAYRPGWFEDPSRDNIAFATIIVYIDSILFALAVSLAVHWIWKAIIIAGIGCMLLWLIGIGVLYVSGIWPYIILILMQVALLHLLTRINRILTPNLNHFDYG